MLNVGNVGHLEYTNLKKAVADFNHYKRQSRAMYGRAGGENVVLFDIFTDRVIREHHGVINEDHTLPYEYWFNCGDAKYATQLAGFIKLMKRTSPQNFLRHVRLEQANMAFQQMRYGTYESNADFIRDCRYNLTCYNIGDYVFIVEHSATEFVFRKNHNYQELQ